MLNFNKSREGLEEVSVSLAPTLISGSVHCRGHLSGNADVVVEGEFSGTIRIGGRLIIRPAAGSIRKASNAVSPIYREKPTEFFTSASCCISANGALFPVMWRLGASELKKAERSTAIARRWFPLILCLQVRRRIFL